MIQAGAEVRIVLRVDGGEVTVRGRLVYPYHGAGAVALLTHRDRRRVIPHDAILYVEETD